MTLYIQLFFEFFKTGLFSIGGGLASLPFLYDIASRYDWFTAEMLPDMIAISESTPGPLGVKMAAYAGFAAAGIPGAVIAALALALPSVLIIISVAGFLKKFNENFYVKSAFYGLRPAVTGLIALAGWEIFEVSILTLGKFELTKHFADLISVKGLILGVALYYLLVKFKKHPIIYIAAAAVCGIVFKF